MTKSRKRKELEQAPEMLLWEIPFEFASALSLDECSSRLHGINAQHFFFSARRKVFLSSIEPKKVLFHLSASGGRLGEGWAVGYLEESPGNGTRVMGKVGVSPEILFSFILVGVGGLLLIPILLRSFGAFLFFATFMAGLLFIIRAGVIHIRVSLVERLRSILEASSV
jgi:hypothetical protein